MKIKQSAYTTFQQEFSFNQLEEVLCPLCNTPSFRLLTKEEIFEIRECPQCRLLYVSPQPSDADVKRFYDSMYETQQQTFPKERKRLYVEKHLVKLLDRLAPSGGNLLEIGCGFGFFLRLLQNKPWKCHAIEPSALAVRYVQEHLPHVSVKEGTIETVSLEPESQDCVVAVAVLEHVKKPQTAICKMVSSLRRGGLVIIQVPYIAAFLKLKRFLPFVPICMEAPRHLFDFSPKALRKMLENAGMRDIGVDIARPYCSPSLLLESITWGVKVPGILLHRLSWRKWVYPFAGAFVIWGRKSP